MRKVDFKCALLVEGRGEDTSLSKFLSLGSAGRCAEFVELVAASQLVRKYKLPTFDSVASFGDPELTKLLYESYESRERPLVILHLLGAFVGIAVPTKELIDLLVRTPLKVAGVSMPRSLMDLSPENYYKFLNAVDIIFKGRDLEELLRECDERRHVMAAQLSKRRLLHHLDSHPEISTIYALIGAAHLNDFDKITEDFHVVARSDREAFLNFTHKARVIHLKLFGGEHKTIDHYNRMHNCMVRDGVIVAPIIASAPGPLSSSFFRAVPASAGAVEVPTVPELTPEPR